MVQLPWPTGIAESDATEAAAVAYLDAREANPDFDENGPCGKAAKAYIEEFQY